MGEGHKGFGCRTAAATAADDNDDSDYDDDSSNIDNACLLSIEKKIVCWLSLTTVHRQGRLLPV